MYDDEELEEIQNEFKRKELLVHSLGPSVSLIIHVVLFLILFFVVKAQFEEPETEVVVEMVEEATEEVIETPEDIDSIEETALQSSDTAPSDEVSEESEDDVNTDVAEETLDVSVEELFSFDTTNNSAYQTRTLQGKAKQVAKAGGDKRALSTVLSSLKWLRANQNPDGSWGTPGNPNINSARGGITGLATLLYLAHGETPSSKQFGKTVQKALQWLTAHVKTLKPRPNEPNRGITYSLAIVTYALSEGYSLTSIDDLKTGMDEGVEALLRSLNPNGWADYNPGLNDDRDLSLTGWYWQAFKAAYLAGCENKKMKKYIETIPDKVKMNGYNVRNPKEKSPMNSFKYRTSSHWTSIGAERLHYGENEGEIIQQSAANRAIGALVLQLFNKKQDAFAAAKVISRNDINYLNKDTKQGYPLYSWYYATQVMYNNKKNDPVAWTRWNQQFQALLYKTQFKDGHWETTGIRPEINAYLGNGINRKVYSTALAGLMLTVYYRYLPTTKLAPPTKKKKVTADTVEVELDFL